MKWQKAINIEDGVHKGVIKRVEYRDEPYEYVDIYVQLSDTEIELKYSCPQSLSESSKIGRLLMKFGVKPNYDSDEDVKVEKYLVGQVVTFMTLKEKSKKDPSREYSVIVDDSLKLATVPTA